MNQKEIFDLTIKEEKIKENDIIKFINNNRNYPQLNFQKEDLINQYTSNNKLYKNSKIGDYNELVKIFRLTGIRLMTWNIHFFADVKTNGNMENILTTIKKIDPDILCLNEVTTNKTKYNDKDLPLQIGNLINFTFCSIVPSWFMSPYGTALYIKNELLQQIYIQKTPKCMFPIKRECTLNQKNKTFNIDNDEVEQKCFIKISLKDFDIICIHLEAYSFDVRIEQLKQINKEITRKTIIMGDFNIFNEKDFIGKKYDKINPKYDNYINSSKKEKKKMYKKMNSEEKIELTRKILTSDEYVPKQETNEMNFIKNTLKWKDSFEMANMIPISYTNWTGIRVDYIFFTKEWLNEDIITSRTYFSDNSDHLPIICDILPELYFNPINSVDIKYWDNDLRKDNDLTGMDIWNYENKIGEKPKDISTEHFIELYNKNIDNINNGRMLFGGPVDKISDINNIFFYNGQTSNHINWFKPKNNLELGNKYNYQDPTLTSKEPKGNVMGVNGVYATDSIDFSLNYAVNFSKKKVNKGSYPIIFIFKLNLSDNDKNNIKIGMMNYRLMGKNYDDKFDNEYDIILLNERFFQSNALQLKFTKRFFEKFKMELVKIINLGDPNYNYIYFENSKKYMLSTQKIFDTKNIYLLFKYVDISKYKNKSIDEIKLIINNMDTKDINNNINNYINNSNLKMTDGNSIQYSINKYNFKLKNTPNDKKKYIYRKKLFFYNNIKYGGGHKLNISYDKFYYDINYNSIYAYVHLLIGCIKFENKNSLDKTDIEINSEICPPDFKYNDCNFLFKVGIQSKSSYYELNGYSYTNAYCVHDKINNDLAICFLPGNVTPAEYFSRDTINGYVELYEKIINICKNINYNNIHLVGHSNGMSCAIMFGYFIMIIEDNIPETEYKLETVDKFLNFQIKKNRNNNDEIQRLQNSRSKFETNILQWEKQLKEKIKNLKMSMNGGIMHKIFICGGGGFPVLFKNRNEWENFLKNYNYKFIHFINKINTNNGYIYDPYMHNIYGIDVLNFDARDIDNFNKIDMTKLQQYKILEYETYQKEYLYIHEYQSYYNKLKKRIIIQNSEN